MFNLLSCTPNSHWWDRQSYRFIDKRRRVIDQVLVSFWKTDSKRDDSNTYTTVELVQEYTEQELQYKSEPLSTSEGWDMVQAWTESSSESWSDKLKEV